MTLEAPPTQQPIITDEGALPALPWVIFFNSIFNGDAGEAWVPNIQGLTAVGGVPQITGRVYRLSQYLSLFVVTVVPAPGGNTSSTAGSAFIDNYPLDMTGNGFCVAVSGNLGTNAGMCDEVTNRIYQPGWTTVTVPLTIIGIVEAR